MASPPNPALSTSPPNPSNTSLPSKKRPSLGPQTSAPSKRRKPSLAPSALRQTSFPPEEFADPRALVRSPSVESSLAGSSIVGGGGGSSKRGRKRKSDGRSAGGSVKGGGKAGTTTGSVRSGDAKVGGALGVKDEEAEEEEGEGEGEGEDNTKMVHEEGHLDGQAEKEKLLVLVEAFDHDQSDRYDLYRRVKLRKETVRKIANQTLSQSVPPSVLTTINGYTKIFIGEIIEKARSIQTQYMAAASSDGIAHERHRGPLLPDHLREAVRRYKKNGEAGGAGFQGLSLGGVEQARARAGGKRLFR
ncbi:MAG: hypothetical protein M1827_000358 [Pycnora praestabilis]|nr:MAG: hypothetical protein M1827_000358 [Pycnora praestabilis]